MGTQLSEADRAAIDDFVHNPPATAEDADELEQPIVDEDSGESAEPETEEESESEPEAEEEEEPKPEPKKPAKQAKPQQSVEERIRGVQSVYGKKLKAAEERIQELEQASGYHQQAVDLRQRASKLYQEAEATFDAEKIKTAAHLEAQAGQFEQWRDSLKTRAKMREIAEQEGIALEDIKDTARDEKEFRLLVKAAKADKHQQHLRTLEQRLAELEKSQQKQTARARVAGAADVDLAQPAASGKRDVDADLRRLNVLFNSGKISGEAFRKRKAQLLEG